MTATDDARSAAITRAAVAMAGGPGPWAALGPEIRALYRELAKRAADALLGGTGACDEHQAP